MKIIDYKELTEEQARAGCFVLNMPNEAYHNYEGISKSSLDLINRSPAHYLLGAKFEPSPAMRMGTIVHTAILEPARFRDEYMVLHGINDKRKSEYKEAVKIHGADNVLTDKEATQVISLQETIGANEDAAQALAACNMFEVSAFVEIRGVICRCRYDAINIADAISVDLKTTKCSNREEFAKSVFNFRYHVQDAWYSEIFQRITGKRLTFKFLAVENEPPHCPMVYELDDEAKMIGADSAVQNFNTFRKAYEANHWKGYEQTNEPLSLPSWALAQYENKLDEEIV